jgi:hypothetical protein
MGTNKFGWCLTGHHDKCLEISSSDYCRCECHVKKEVK